MHCCTHNWNQSANKGTTAGCYWMWMFIRVETFFESLNPLFCCSVLLPGHIKKGAKGSPLIQMDLLSEWLVSRVPHVCRFKRRSLMHTEWTLSLQPKLWWLCGQLVRESAWIKLGNPGNAERPRGSVRRHSVTELKWGSLVNKTKQKKRKGKSKCLLIRVIMQRDLFFSLVLGKK